MYVNEFLLSRRYLSGTRKPKRIKPLSKQIKHFTGLQIFGHCTNKSNSSMLFQ